MNLKSKKLIALAACSTLLSTGFASAEGNIDIIGNPGGPAAVLVGSYDTPKEFTVQVEDKVLSGARPIIREDRTLLPFRVLFENLGAEVEYEPFTKTIEAVMGGKDIKMSIGSKSATVGTEPFTLAVAPLIEGSTAYIPLRDVANISGLTADYSALEKKINIYDKDAFIANIDKNFSIYNTILQSSDKDQMKKVFKSSVNLSGNVEFLDEGNIKKAGGEINFDGLTRGMDINGSFDLKLDLASLIQESSGSMTPESLKLMKDLMLSHHQLILDSKGSTIYLKSPLLAETLGEPEDTWFRMSGQSLGSMSQALSLMNMGYMTDLMNKPKEATMGKVLYESIKAQADILAGQGRTNYMPTIYDQVSISARMVNILIGDDGFRQNGRTYTMDLDKKAIMARAQKYLPEAAAEINTAFKDVEALNYKLVLSDIDSKNVKMQMNIKGSAKTNSGSIPFNMDINTTGQTNSKIDFSLSIPKKGKLVFHMDAKSAETGQSISTAPPADSLIKDIK